MKKLDELKTLAAEGKWPPATEDQAKQILAATQPDKTKKKSKRSTKKAKKE